MATHVRPHLNHTPKSNVSTWNLAAPALAKSVGMGLSPALLPIHAPSEQHAESLESRTCTTIRRLSLEVQGGGFDVPKEKCPPDIHSGGSLNEVTARSAPPSSSSFSFLQTQNNRQQQQRHTPHSYPTSNPATHYHHQHHGLALPKKSNSTGSITSSTVERAILSRPITAPRSPLQDLGGFASFQRPVRSPSGSPPLTPPSSTSGSSLGELVNGSRHATSAAVDIPQTKKATKVINGFTISISVGQNHPLETPPSTPDDASSSSGIAGWGGSQDLKFLEEIFPTASRALPYAKSVQITQDGMTWDGFVLEIPGKPKTLYVCGRGAERVQLRESIVALLDLADEHLGCSAFVIALEKQSPALAGLIHSLMYVSGQVVTRPPFQVDPKWVLVGMEI